MPKRTRKYNRGRGRIQLVSVFRMDKIPSLSRIPKELGREERECVHCGERAVHIYYRVPKRFALFLYRRDHPENLHATCMSCAKSTILRGEERESILSRRPERG